MAYKKTLKLLFVATITLIGLNLAPAFAATPGTWVGMAEFGTFDLEVNAQGIKQHLFCNFQFIHSG